MKTHSYFKDIYEKNISQEFRLINIDETRNHLVKEIEQNELMSRKHKNVCTNVNHIEHFIILACSITGCITISAFAFLLGLPLGITSSTIGLKTYALAAGIKKYRSIIKKHYKIVLSAIFKRNSIEVLIIKALIDSNISHNEFVPMINVLKEYNNMKEVIKN